MAKNLYALLFGLLFGFGLIVAQMSNPEKVLAFLDITGDWDASLALVMASALLVLVGSQKLVPLFYKTEQAEAPQLGADSLKSGIDSKLFIGSSIFGLGWGLSGICPGPAIVGLSSGLPGSYVFIAAMFAGFVAFKYLHRK